MEDGAAFNINRQCTAMLDQATVRDIATGYDMTIEIDNIPDMDVFQVLSLDRRGQDFLVAHKVTPECDVIV